MSDALDGATVAVIGYGNQGAPQARALRASGLSVRIGLRNGAPSAAGARAAGFDVRTLADAVAGTNVLRF